MMSRTDDESAAKETTKRQWKKLTTISELFQTIFMVTLQILNMELLFRDLFALHDRFKELGMVIKNGEVHLPDLEERDV